MDELLYDNLRRMPLFQTLESTALRSLTPMLVRRRMSRGELLIRQGEIGAECFVVLEGELEVYTFSEGDEIQHAVRPPGTLIGEMALMDDEPRSASVRALVDSEVAVFDRQSFFFWLHNDQGFSERTIKEVFRRVRESNAKMGAKQNELEKTNRELLQSQAEVARLSRIEQEFAVARRIQQFFLPRSLPQTNGWQLDAFNRGAQEVGGDFYDCIELPQGRLGLIVADVCGKGVAAALFVALTRSLVRALSLAPWPVNGSLSLESDNILDGALWLTNDYITREHGDYGMFITLFYAVLDTRSGVIHYVNAGHNPPMIIGQDREIRFLDSENLPVGIIAKQDFDPKQAQLEPGEILVCFSDGITEAMNRAGEPFGDDTFMDMLRDNVERTPEEIVSTIVDAVDTYAGTEPQADDMTLLIIKHPGAVGDKGSQESKDRHSKT